MFSPKYNPASIVIMFTARLNSQWRIAWTCNIAITGNREFNAPYSYIVLAVKPKFYYISWRPKHIFLIAALFLLQFTVLVKIERYFACLIKTSFCLILEYLEDHVMKRFSHEESEISHDFLRWDLSFFHGVSLNRSPDFLPCFKPLLHLFFSHICTQN